MRRLEAGAADLKFAPQARVRAAALAKAECETELCPFVVAEPSRAALFAWIEHGVPLPGLIEVREVSPSALRYSYFEDRGWGITHYRAHRGYTKSGETYSFFTIYVRE